MSGVVTINPGGAPITGATVMLGARSTTTDGAGGYSFTNIPAATYPGMAATFPGYLSATATTIVVTDGGTTTQNFSLATAPAAGCLTDTSQSDFLAGISTNVDPNASPGDVKLTIPPFENADQVSSPAALSTTNNLSATTDRTDVPCGITGNLTGCRLGWGWCPAHQARSPWKFAMCRASWNGRSGDLNGGPSRTLGRRRSP